jgi:hypothetical protein
VSIKLAGDFARGVLRVLTPIQRAEDYPLHPGSQEFVLKANEDDAEFTRWVRGLREAFHPNCELADKEKYLGVSIRETSEAEIEFSSFDLANASALEKLLGAPRLRSKPSKPVVVPRKPAPLPTREIRRREAALRY